MIIGDPNVFAIEYEVFPKAEMRWGSFRLWLNGESIGDFTQQCFITQPLGQLHDTLYSIGDRQNAALTAMSADKCLDEIWGKALMDDSLSWEESVIYHQYLWLCGDPFSESFRSVHLDTSNGVRLIWQETDEAPVKEICLPFQIYTSVIHGTLQMFQEQTAFTFDEPNWFRQQVKARIKEGRNAQAERNRKVKYQRREAQREIARYQKPSKV